jgi:hypothetical protein
MSSIDKELKNILYGGKKKKLQSKKKENNLNKEKTSSIKNKKNISTEYLPVSEEKPMMKRNTYEPYNKACFIFREKIKKHNENY